MKNFLKKITELKNDPKGKALLFFGSYFIFFIILMIIFRVSVKNPLGKYEYESGEANNFSTIKIEAENYKYKYEINLDGLSYILEGQKNKYNEMFTYMNKNYYKNLENYFVLENGIWLKCSNPNNYFYFMEINNLKELIDKAYLLSKTDYESGKKVYNYLITTNTIEKIYKNIDIDIEDEASEITISTDENGDINQIKLKLDSFCKYENICTNELKINLSFADFGEVPEIESPI